MRVTIITLGIAAVLTTVSSRAVNISNTWMLPEEGFPVFYRYFRDRISWNEADAVCQFHHANLVTVDSTSQYDAIRAYLKELDITNYVWIGLMRAADKTSFSWRDFRELSTADHWQEALPDGGGEPLCVAMDPAADFRWHALTCAGPEVAAFICELPVPAWASGAEGCLITELPSLTVLYIPEQSAVELTSDCGQGGTKRIVCKGNANRDEITRRLACNEDSLAFPAPTSAVTSTLATTNYHSESRTTKPHIWTSNTIDTGDYGVPTRHRRETEETSASPGTVSTSELPATMTDGTTVMDPIGPEEYPSAINQGQLFSIIENGTLFDIIELNGTEENKTLAPPEAAPSVVVQNEEITSTKTPSELTKEALPDLSANIKNATLQRTFRKKAPIFRKPDTNIDIDVTNDIQPAKAIQQVARIAETRLHADANPENNYNSEPTTKPNRQRQLTRSNRRSFYPYFFSRVLG